MPVIETRGLTKYYGRHRGIIDVDITVEEGEIFGFIGPNGAGKSTMIKTLLNFLYPTRGSARVLGMDCVTQSHLIKRKTGYVPGEVRFYEDITVSRLLDYSLSFYRGADRGYALELARRFELEMKKKFGELSSGNKKKTALVAALSISPQLMILDEPASGLDPLMQHTLFEALLEQKQKGNTVFLSSHNLDEVQSLCDRVAIIREGRIADIRRMDDLKAAHDKRITVFADAFPDNFAQGVGFRTVLRENGKMVVAYSGQDMNRVAAELAKLELKDFTVEDTRLSDIFMSYYEKGE